MKFEVFGSSSKPYIVDTENLTCTCPNWKFKCAMRPKESESRLCKHLNQVLADHPELKSDWMIKSDNLNLVSGKDPDGKVRFPRAIFDVYISDIRSIIDTYDSSIVKYEICGSYRRLADRISDLDVLIVVKEGCSLDEMYDYCENVLMYQRLWRGDKKASYKIDGFVQVDFKVVPEESWAFSLMHFTGPKDHNIKMRATASRKGYSLSEYGLKDSSGSISTQNLRTEMDVYEFLGVPYVHPWDRK